MKSFFVHIVEFLALMVAGITAIQFVKNGHSAFGLGVLVIYGGIMLMRLWLLRVDFSYSQNINNAQKELLEGRLTTVTAQTRRLEAVLVDAATKALWVSDVKIRDNKAVYKIDAPGRGRIVIYLPATEEDAKTNDAPVASSKG